MSNEEDKSAVFPAGNSLNQDKHGSQTDVARLGHDSTHRHISHSVALTSEVSDPATAQHIVHEEEKWAADNSEGDISST